MPHKMCKKLFKYKIISDISNFFSKYIHRTKASLRLPAPAAVSNQEETEER